jgi:hypothetical protein
MPCYIEVSGNSNKKRMKNNKWYIKIALIIISSVLLFMIAGSFLFSYLIKKNINEAQFGNFMLKSESVDTNLIKRQITLAETEIITENSENKFIVPEAKLRGIHLFKLIFGKGLTVDNVAIAQPVIRYYSKQKNQKNSKEISSPDKIQKRTVHIKKFDIQGAELFLLNEQPTKPDTIFSTVFNAEVWDITTDSLSFGYNAEYFYFQHIKLVVQKGSFPLKNSLYTFSTDSLYFDSRAQILYVDSARLVTRHTKTELGQITGVETDWYNFSFKELEIQNINIKNLSEKPAIVSKQIQIADFMAEIYRDKRLPFPKKPDTKLPSEILENLPLDIHCDSFLILNANISYEEKVNNTFKEAVIKFNDMQVGISNLSNMRDLIRGPTVMQASAKVMNSTWLNARFDIPNKKFSNGYKTQGTLQPSEIVVFNPVIVPNASARIESGKIKSFEFNFNYSETSSAGNLILEYENLGIAFLNEEDGSKRKLKSLIANSFAIKEENLKGTKSYKSGTISFERDKKKSVFNYWWKSVFSGIKSISIV